MEECKGVYQKMLREKFYLYRPWIPICKSIEAEAISNLALTPPALDIGCGNGLFAAYCFNEKIDVGLDYDTKAIDSARERGVYKRVKAGDACSIPFQDDIFRTVISICTIEHIPDLDGALSSVYRVLKRDGKFIFTVPSEKFGDFLFISTLMRALGLKGLAKRYGNKKNNSSGHLHLYTSSKWNEILKAKGFDVESIGYIFPKEAVFLWSFLHSTLFKILFLPFRFFKDLNVKIVDKILRSTMDSLFSNRIAKYSRIDPSSGGYLLIQARKA